jgi:hypothetical protein
MAELISSRLISFTSKVEDLEIRGKRPKTKNNNEDIIERLIVSTRLAETKGFLPVKRVIYGIAKIYIL